MVFHTFYVCYAIRDIVFIIKIEMWKNLHRHTDEALAMKRAIHRQYGNNRHCHGVALFVDAA